jgi:integrase
VLCTAFNIAKKWQYVAQNPFLDATLPEFKSKERDALTSAELQKVLDETDNPDDYDIYLIHCAMILAFFCSLRGGEIGAIQWSDVYFDEGKIDIWKAIDRVSKKLIDKLPKAEVYYQFPNLYPGTKSVIVLKNTKTEGSNRIANFQAIVAQKLLTLKEIQGRLKEELGEDGYIDYGLVICQANGRPIMTEHLNKRFKTVLQRLGMKEVVFHSIRVTSTTVKLRLSGGDIKAVQGENGHKDPKMVTKQYSRIFEEDDWL